MTDTLRFNKDIPGAFKAGEILPDATKKEIETWTKFPGVELVQPETKEIKPEPEIKEKIPVQKTKPEPEIPQIKEENKPELKGPGTTVLSTPGTTILEPVMDEKGILVWLFSDILIVSEAPLPHVKMKDILTHDKPLKQIKNFHYIPQALWRCNKCGGTSTLSVDKEPEICVDCNRASRFKPYTKTINPDFWKIPHWQDLHDTTGSYQELYDLVKKCLVFVEDIQYKIYVLDIISSYFMDQWETIGYPAFIGLIESGKSRALDLIAETGWRMINAGSGVSFPAMVRGTHLYNAGILIDEAHDKLTSKTESGQQMIDFLKPGYRRGSHYIIADKENPEKIISYNNFGFKAFAAEREFDRAMMSRCKVYEMEQDYPEIQNLKDIRDKLNLIQTKLLNLKYKRTTPIPELPQDIGINGRNLEIFGPTIRTAAFLGIDYQDVLVYAKQRKDEEVESFRNTDEWEVLNAIKNGEENEKIIDAPEETSYADLLNKLGWEDIVIDGKTRSAKQRLGYVFKKLQLKTKKKHEGTVLLLNDPKNARKLKYLYRRYKV